ncbi:hypothetical protein H696_02911 [Fonticula alba]|uniref:PhoD-like phosphatase metallophosphatase domain-containing protein n=1 Tax=Fonticula alba TaxID=691883 RepID=A0A058Z8Z9_FONAL|nr:hypothetical protein H696_02911 [Fonticula alba]KCV70566.1 hypothetical protein H696_02911 [Fonticula alba]|eukprot:XP_009495082.1 hypothetical protein H696_02911 [Fonticula alba]
MRGLMSLLALAMAALLAVASAMDGAVSSSIGGAYDSALSTGRRDRLRPRAPAADAGDPRGGAFPTHTPLFDQVDQLFVDSRRLLLAVGAVGPSHARILFQPLAVDLLQEEEVQVRVVSITDRPSLPEQGSALPADAGGADADIDLVDPLAVETGDMAGGRLVHETVVSLRHAAEAPHVLRLAGLQPATQYAIHFHVPGPLDAGVDAAEAIRSRTVERAFFRTPAGLSAGGASQDVEDPEAEPAVAPGRQTPLRFLTVSCNRLNEDLDTSLWRELATRERLFDASRGNIDLSLHLGDQVYADAISKSFMARMTAPAAGLGHQAHLEALTYPELLDIFRRLYRGVFGHAAVQPVLRHGSTVMIPDDHEFVNSISPELVRPGAVMATVMAAARRAYLEYQYQLTSDAFDEYGHELPHLNEGHSIYHFFRWADVAFLMLDVRLHRSYVADPPESPLLGAEQMARFLAMMEHIRTDPTVSHTVIAASVPLIYSGEEAARIVYAIEEDVLPMHPSVQGDTFRLLDAISDLGDSASVIGGDIHMFMEAELTNTRNGKKVRQYATSGMTVGSTVGGSHTRLLPFFIFTFRVLPLRVGHWTMKLLRGVVHQNYLIFDISPPTGTNAQVRLRIQPFFLSEWTLSQRIGQSLFEVGIPLATTAALGILAILLMRRFNAGRRTATTPAAPSN